MKVGLEAELIVKQLGISHEAFDNWKRQMLDQRKEALQSVSYSKNRLEEAMKSPYALLALGMITYAISSSLHNTVVFGKRQI